MSDHPRKIEEKSTTVRADHWKRRTVRGGLRALGAIAPGAVDRIAARLFMSPRRRKTIVPVVAGLEAREATVSYGGYELATWSWGEGPAVLLAHGWEGHAGQMARFASRLVTRGFRAV